MEPQKLLDLIGNTPLMESEFDQNKKRKTFIEARRKQSEEASKTEHRNMMVSAPREGHKKGDKLIEATSGNTGIALAMIAQLLGIEIELILPEDSTKERTNHACLWGNGHIDTAKGRNPGPRETMPTSSRRRIC
jgi:cysteine synthase B